MYEPHNTHLAYLNDFFLVFFRNYIVLLFAFLTFLTSTFQFLYFYILVLSKYLGNINWEVLQLAKLGKPRLPRNL